MRKNVASQVIGAQMITAADGTAFTGSVTVYVTGDAGTQAVGSVASGACTHEGNGYHTYAPAQAETNYDLIAFTFIGTGAIPVTVQIYTRHDANVTHYGATAGTFSGGRPEVNTTHLAGTSQTARDIGASVLLSNGTGTGQVSLSSGVVSANAVQLSGDSTAADNAEAFFDGTGYAGTNNVIPTVTNLTNAPTSGDLTATMKTSVETAVSNQIVAYGLDHLLSTSVTGTDVADDSIIAKLVSKSATADWDSYANTTDALEALRDRGDAAWTTATGFSTHSAADVWAVGTRTLTALDEDSTTLDLDATIRAAIGMASANLDTQLTAIDDYLDTEIAAIKTVTDAIGATGSGLSAIPWNAAWDAEVQSEVNDALVANNLDHLCLTATGSADMTSEVADNTILARILSNGDTSVFDPSTDGLQPIRDNMGTAQTGDSYTRLGAPAGASVSADIAAVKSDTAAILLDTGTDGVVVASGSKSGYALSSTGLNAVVPAEPSGAPVWNTTTLVGWLGWLGALAANRVTQTSSVQTLRNATNNADLATAAVSDDATTFVRDTWS